MGGTRSRPECAGLRGDLRRRVPEEIAGLSAVSRRITAPKTHGRTTSPIPIQMSLIIGAGPTGAVAAKRFLEAGMRVVVLEQGDWPDYSKARADHPDFELTMGRYWSGNPNRRQAPRGLSDRRQRTPTSRPCSTTRSAAARSFTPRIGSATCRRIFACARSTAWPTTGR